MSISETRGVSGSDKTNETENSNQTKENNKNKAP